ncbi:MAG: MBL fold metallo-hydrolase [bacterium]|nr:MBL fold metallo-hydrolase [bacterium]
MIITHLGDTYFKIQSGSFTLLIDPQNSRSFKGANVIINTERPAIVAREKNEEESFFWIENEGEYEVGGVKIEGWTLECSKKEKTISAYRLSVEDIAVGIIGPTGKEPAPEVLEKLQGVDVLILPGGGAPSIEEEEAVKLVRQIEPGFVIPSGNGSKKFFTELGQTPKVEEKLVLKKKDVSPGAMTAVSLSS